MTEGMTIGERVACYRNRRGMPQEVLAGLIGRTADWLRTQRLLASVYQLTTGLLTKIGEADLASLSATKGLSAAHVSGSELMIGSLYRSVAHAPLSLGVWTAFGPTNVAIHRVTTAMELGDMQVAIDLGLRIDTARAFDRRNRVDSALDTLLNAERQAPEQVRYRQLSRILVQEIIRRPRPPSRAIELAARMVCTELTSRTGRERCRLTRIRCPIISAWTWNSSGTTTTCTTTCTRAMSASGWAAMILASPSTSPSCSTARCSHSSCSPREFANDGRSISSW